MLEVEDGRSTKKLKQQKCYRSSFFAMAMVFETLSYLRRLDVARCFFGSAAANGKIDTMMTDRHMIDRRSSMDDGWRRANLST
jgi:hypothetical protein